MKSFKCNLVVMSVMVASMVFQGFASEHVVGDESGWTIPSNENFYGEWATKNTFQANDVLVFNFDTGRHNVAQVTKDAYDACDGSNPISLYTDAPARITIDPSKDQFYICTIGPHCNLFQKLAISV